MDEQDMSAQPVGNGADTAPVVGVLTQYVKDLSFENPNAPGVYQSQSPQRVDVQFNIASNAVAEDIFEVILKIDVRSESDDGVGFVVDLSYAGLFGLRNVPEEHLQPFLLGEAPRLLFPFARRVLADAVRDGGFQPLMLEPIDFNALYLEQVQQQLGGEMPVQDFGNA